MRPALTAVPLLATVLLVCAPAASAGEVVSADFPITTTGVAIRYGAFGYTDDAGEFVALAGLPIVSTRITLDYRPAPGEDVADLRIAFAVPVTGADSDFIGFEGTSFVEASPGRYTYALTSDDYDGTVRGGSFGLEVYSLDPDTGDPLGTAGVWTDSAITFDVVVPEPAAAAAAVAAASTIVGRRRRTLAAV